VELTILGKSPSWQDAGGACSGYLVESDGTRVLLDCGSGVFGKLREVCDYHAVDAVVISHFHGDHVLDLVPYGSALVYGPRRGLRPRLLAPPGGREAFRRLSAAAGMREEHMDRAFAIEEYDPAATVEVGALRVRFQPVPHYMPANAIDVAGDGGRLTYSADTSPSDDLCAFARATDLLLIEATLPHSEDDEEPRGHMSPAEAGDHGRRAGARRLVLTHLSDELDAERARAEAERAFGGPVEVARGGAIYRV
jgi:ribonuclease BN (tRNA processing enzyme)